ncbi:hypothetical protein E3N88_30346 [Mikania micrantha]|uniref:Uncharacterized protein n=1 Tax=Mikania micrantha TaxID=192012 RepID=A0A5N6MM44_9ASTR|nr:hypothetical protein E3N88_30346 [Mikania micrantha]
MAVIYAILQDSFYHSLSDEESANPQSYNFDHPDSFDTELLVSCMEALIKGQSVNIPDYDYKTHQKIGPGRMVNPSDVIILEGILVLHDERVRDLMNIKIFVDSDSDVRLGRRIKRDTVERGRNIQYVLDQYANHVKPSFEEFILPSKKHADIIIPRGADNNVAIDLIVQHIRTKLGQHDLCKIYQNLFVIPSTFQVNTCIIYLVFVQWCYLIMFLVLQIRGMHTLIRDAKTRKHDFVFYADRLIRLVVEHGLGHLPFTEKQIITPTESIYTGVVFCKRLCGVSIIRSGESMENALRACCKGIKIGKVLIQREGNGRQLIYEKLPKDIASRQVLLLDPVLASGCDSAMEAISLLLNKGVSESNIIFLNLIAAPEGIRAVCKQYPRLKIVTSEIDAGLNEHSRVIPGMGQFGDRYFGTDDREQSGSYVKHWVHPFHANSCENSYPNTPNREQMNLPSTLLPSIDLGYIEDKYSGLSSQALLNVWSSLRKKSILLHEPEDTKIWVPTNPRGAETLPPGIVTSESDLYLRRLYGTPSEDLIIKPRYLVTFTVGYEQKDNINKAVKKFSENFSILLFHYDGRTSEWNEFEWSHRAIHVSVPKQTKWWYAKRFLHPDILASYDYIFIWDEDLGLEDFDPERYISLVKKHGLEISQPGLSANSGLTWQMTRKQNDSEVHKEAEERDGWCTDPHLPPCAAFVEIMAPVFSRNAWRCVWYMIQNDLVHGWGLDFSLRRCVEPAHEKIGVVDAQWVVHQTVPSLGNQGKSENGKAAWEGV